MKLLLDADASLIIDINDTDAIKIESVLVIS